MTQSDAVKAHEAWGRLRVEGADADIKLVDAFLRQCAACPDLVSEAAKKGFDTIHTDKSKYSGT